MLKRQAVGKTVVALLALVAVTGASFGAGGLVQQTCIIDLSGTPGLGASYSGVDCPREACCCGAKAAPRACACQRPNERPVAPPPVRDDSRALELAPWIASLATVWMAAAAESAAPAGPCDFFTPTSRSVQTLLCVWRI
jgi:hypothetical protein